MDVLIKVENVEINNKEIQKKNIYIIIIQILCICYLT